jgi:hypothetical protein
MVPDTSRLQTLSAVVRLELHEFADASLTRLPVAGYGGIPSHQELNELAERLRDRLYEVQSASAGEVAAIANASVAAHDAVQALSGSVPDGVDIR